MIAMIATDLPPCQYSGSVIRWASLRVGTGVLLTARMSHACLVLARYGQGQSWALATCRASELHSNLGEASACRLWYIRGLARAIFTEALGFRRMRDLVHEFDHLQFGTCKGLLRIIFAGHNVVVA